MLLQSSLYSWKNNPTPLNIQSMFPANSESVKSSCLSILSPCLSRASYHMVCQPVYRRQVCSCPLPIPSGCGSEEQRSGRAASGVTSHRCGNETSASGSLPASEQRGLPGLLSTGPLPCPVTTRRPSPRCHLFATVPGISPLVSATGGQGGGHWDPRGRAGTSALRFSVTLRGVSVGDRAPTLFVWEDRFILQTRGIQLCRRPFGMGSRKRRSPVLIFN